MDAGLAQELTDELESLKAEDPAAYQQIREELMERFELALDEIF